MLSRTRRSRVVSEINITPFTDVVLVLLVIFMITTPLMLDADHNQGASEAGFDVSLPQAKGNALPSTAGHVVISVLDDGRVVMGGEVVELEALRERLERIKRRDPDTLVIIQADRMVYHWHVVQVMDEASAVGLRRMAVATEEK
jgi:biopolymer transport protein TolR